MNFSTFCLTRFCFGLMAATGLFFSALVGAKDMEAAISLPAFQLSVIDKSTTALPFITDERALYADLARLPEAERTNHSGRLFAVEINLGANPGFRQRAVNGRVELHYDMVFNQITEGWNWFPLANPQDEDYYHAKFLPLSTVSETHPTLPVPEQVASTQNGHWRWDYFLAFENLYDFYPRTPDDEAGFTATLDEKIAPSEIRMLALARLRSPFIAQSSTFWKATLSHPVDFTLKKRYLFADLLQVWFYEAGSGRILAKIHPANKHH